jgi:hypothetical protein
VVRAVAAKKQRVLKGEAMKRLASVVLALACSWGLGLPTNVQAGGYYRPSYHWVQKVVWVKKYYSAYDYCGRPYTAYTWAKAYQWVKVYY